MPKIIDHDERRSHIMDVTLALIQRNGFGGATMREIAAEAGFANGSLKHYFPDKEAIILATWERELERQTQYVAEAVGDKRGFEALHELCLAALPLAPEATPAGRVLLSYWEISLGVRALYARYLEHLRGWKDVIHEHLEQARRDGEVATSLSDAEIADHLILLTVGATVLDQIGSEETVKEYQQTDLERYLDGLRVRA